MHNGDGLRRFTLCSFCRPEREERLTPLERERDAFDFDAGTTAAGGAEADIVAEDFDPFERPVGRDGGVEAEAVFEDPGDGRRVDREIIVADLCQSDEKQKSTSRSQNRPKARTYKIGTAADDFATRPRDYICRAFRVCVCVLPVNIDQESKDSASLENLPEESIVQRLQFDLTRTVWPRIGSTSWSSTPAIDLAPGVTMRLVSI